MKIFTTELRDRIQIYHKNRLDISPLIDGYSIKGEDLSGCVIKKFNRMKEDISYCNLSRCIIGEKDEITHLSRANMEYCNFQDTVFLGKIWLRYVNARGCNFHSAFVPFVEYQYGDFRDCNFCDCVWRMGSRAGHHAIINKEILEKWALNIL